MSDFIVKNGVSLGGSLKKAEGTIAGNATLDLSSGNYFSHTPTADTTFVFNNPPAAGKAHGFALKVTGANVAAGYDLANAAYDSVSFSVAAQDTSPTGLFFKPDGINLYISGDAGNNINQYSLGTAWDISTASYVQNFSVATQEVQPSGLFFKLDGTRFYISGAAGQDINEYSLSTAWDISTASYVQNFSVSAQDSVPSGLSFKPDGTKMYVIGRSSISIHEYDLSTAWDISTASYVQSLSVNSQESNPQGLSFKSDGTKMYVIGVTGDDINEYSLSTAWSISTASYVRNFSVAAQETVPTDLFFEPGGTKMYVVGVGTDTVYQYSTVSATTTVPATFTYPASVKWPNAVAPTAPAVGETDVLTFYTDDGGTTFYGFQAGDAMQ